MYLVRKDRAAARAAAVAVCVVSSALAAACAGPRRTGAAVPIAPAAAAAAAAPAPKPLAHSVFSPDPEGQLSEHRIQEILASRMELALPARLGLLPIVQAKDWHGPGPDFGMAPAALGRLAHKLRGGTPFTMVTEMIPIPSGALGMEALREIAARYKLRYILLYRQDVRRTGEANAWAIGYLTGVGALCLPGATLRVDGYVEASLLDVKTGLLLFTLRRRIDGARGSNIWHHAAKLRALERDLADKAAPLLAADVRRAVLRYRVAAREENQRRREGTGARPPGGAAASGRARTHRVENPG